MIQLSPEDHKAAAALANKMKADFPSVPPKIAIAAVHMLSLEIAVQLAGGKKKAALDFLKAMAHDGRDSIRAYFNAQEERAKKMEATQASMKEADKVEPHVLNQIQKHVKEIVS